MFTRFVTTFVLALVLADSVHAELRGDPKLLGMIAESYRANLANIKTWKGTALLTKQHKTSGNKEAKDWLTEWTVDFACIP